MRDGVELGESGLVLWRPVAEFVRALSEMFDGDCRLAPLELLDSVSPDRPSEVANLAEAINIVCERADRRVVAWKAYGHRLFDYDKRGVTPPFMVGTGRSFAGEHGWISEQIEAIGAAVEICEQWLSDNHLRLRDARRVCRVQAQQNVNSEWLVGGEASVPSWWPRGGLRVSDVDLFTEQEWAKFAVNAVLSVQRHGIGYAVSRSFKAEIARRRGAAAFAPQMKSQ